MQQPAQAPEKRQKKKKLRDNQQKDAFMVEFSEPDFSDGAESANERNQLDANTQRAAIGYNEDFANIGNDVDGDDEQDLFIKTGKLVLFIDSNQDELERSRQSFETIQNFKGEVRYFEDGEETLNFLGRVRSKDGKWQVADLIFLTYSVAQADGLQLMEEIMDFCRARSSAEAPLQPRIIICSSFSL